MRGRSKVFNLFTLAILLAGAPSFAVSQASVDALLYRLFISPIPSLLDPSASKVTAQSLRKLGVTAQQMQEGMEKLQRRYPSLANRRAAGRQYREEFENRANAFADQELGRRQLNSEPSKAFGSLMEFIQNQYTNHDSPIAWQLAQIRAMGKTQIIFGTNDMSDFETRDYFQRAENALVQQEEPKRANFVDEEAFRAWQKDQLEAIKARLVKVYRNALEVAKEGGYRFSDASTAPMEFDEATGTILVAKAKGEFGQMQVRAPRGAVASEGLDGSAIYPDAFSRVVGANTNLDRDAALRRLAVLRASLQEQYRLLHKSREMDPEDAPKLAQALLLSAQRYRDAANSHSLFDSRKDTEYLGEAFSELAHEQRSYNWAYKKLAKHLLKWNPFAQSTSQVLSGKFLRPGFWSKIFPIVVGTHLAMTAGQVAYEEGLLDKPIAEGLRIASAANEIVHDFFDLAPGPVRPDDGKALGIDPSPDKNHNAFELTGELWKEQRLDIANTDEMEDAKLSPLPLKRAPKEQELSSHIHGDVAVSTEGKLALPLRRLHALTNVSLKWGSKRLGPDDFSLFQTEEGLPVAKLKGGAFPSSLHFTGAYALGSITETEHMLRPEGLEKAVTELRDAGIPGLAESLEQEIRWAKNEKRYIPAARLPGLVERHSRYTYSPRLLPKMGDPSNPFYDLSPFRSDGQTCLWQCNGARAAVFNILKIHYAGEAGTKVRSANIFKPDEETKGFGGKVSYPWSHYHAEVGVVDPDGAAENLDGTPKTKDPNASVPVSRAIKGFSRLGQLIPSPFWRLGSNPQRQAQVRNQPPPKERLNPNPPKEVATTDALKAPEPKIAPETHATQTPESSAPESPAPKSKTKPSEEKANASAAPTLAALSVARPAFLERSEIPRPPKAFGLSQRQPAQGRREGAVATAPPDPDPPSPFPPLIDESRISFRVPDPKSVEELDKAWNALQSDDRAKPFLRSSDPTTPVVRVGTLAHALKRYVENQIKFSEIRQILLSANPHNPFLAPQGIEDLPAALEAFKEELQNQMQNAEHLIATREASTKFEDFKKKGGFPSKVLKVVEAARLGQWNRVKVRWDAVPRGCQVKLSLLRR